MEKPFNEARIGLELAKAFEKAGIEFPRIHTVSEQSGEYRRNYGNPTLSEALTALREHGFHLTMIPYAPTGKGVQWTYQLYELNPLALLVNPTREGYPTWEAAALEGIREALTFLS
jgi:hypothetical protein